ncbi:MAG: AmmeMemoRadiSam system protein A [Candidatus Eremiobacteraeota bacterium]|nr:AmmeMemoRadiSam system protein A [Candidatus Eremiobacteraeota bacterium]
MSLRAALLSPHPPLLVPEVGGQRVEQVAATSQALEELATRVARLSPGRVVVITPHGEGHPHALRLYAEPTLQGDFRRFGAAQVRFEVEVDLDFTTRLAKVAQASGFDCLTRGAAPLDHGLMVPLYFLRQAAVLTPVVVICVSNQAPGQHYELGQVLRTVIEEDPVSTVVVASGDLSHRLLPSGPYGFDPAGPEYDRRVCEAISPLRRRALLDIPAKLEQQAGVCASRPLGLMLGMLPEGFRSRLLSYEGPFGVGYAVVGFEPEVEPVRLARQSIELWVRHGRMLAPGPVFEPLLEQPSAAFVTLKRSGKLRGCIGTLEPVTRRLADEIARNAVAACSQDHRFSALTVAELEDLEISVSALHPPEPSQVHALDPARYGVVVRQGRKRGLLLPGIEQIQTVEQQLEAVRHKAGIRGELDGLWRFEVTRWD